MRSFLMTAAALAFSAGSAFAQLEYIADWAPDPLPEVDLEATPQVHYMHEFDEEPLYPADFTHWNYENVDAPNGGTMRLASRGTFNSFNPVLDRGQIVTGTGLMLSRLLTSNSDEIDTVYVGDAEYLQLPEDRTWVVYKLRDEMRWPNGEQVTAQDFIWSFLQDLEHVPFLASYWSERLMALRDIGDNRVLAQFNPDTVSKDDAKQIGLVQILPRYFFEEEGKERTLGETFMEPFPGTGAYEISDFEPGRYIEYSLKEDWWGFDVPAYRGVYPETYVYTYYNDREAQREATKAGDIDLFTENSAKQWANAWNGVAAIEAGHLRKERRDLGGLQRPQAMIMNLRRAPFDNRQVRQALNLAFDFEATNEAVFFSQYTRHSSYFQNSDMQANGIPTDEELAVLEEMHAEFGDEYVPDEVFGNSFINATSDREGGFRANLRDALNLLQEAGWTLNEAGELVDENGEQMSFSIIYHDANSARFLDSWLENMRRLGIDANGRLMEPSAWVDSFRQRDFDITPYVVAANYSGSMVYYSWASEFKDDLQSRNFMGYGNPAIDEIGQRLLQAKTREEVNYLSRAADRILTFDAPTILNWYLPANRLVWWDKFQEPSYRPEFASGTTGWFIDETLEQGLIGQSGYSLN